MVAPCRLLCVQCEKFNRLFSTTRMTSKENLRKSRKKGSSNQWLTRQINDPYVKRAQEDGFRCRSAYKLLEINEKFRILKPGCTVIDCGAAPGSWSQVAVNEVNKPPDRGNSRQRLIGKVIGIDLQHIDPIEGVTLLTKCDFTQSETQTRIKNILHDSFADVVLSDMAPAASGNNELDHDKICGLCFSVLEFSSQVLDNGGHVVCKLWDGRDRDKLISVMERMFTEVKIVKPDSSRSESAEIFLVGKNYHLRTP